MTQPSDYYFAKCTRKRVAIVPCQHFDKYGYLNDNVSEIKPLLPAGLLECEESIFEHTKPFTAVAQELRERGFRESKQFTKFMRDLH